MEKRFKLISKNPNQTFIFYFPFILLLTEINAVLYKKNYKRNLIEFGSSAGSKIVFILLTEVITFYMISPIVDV